MRTRVVALVAGTALLAVLAACGGDNDAASDPAAETTTAATTQSTTTVSRAALVGTWAATNEPFVVRFTRDGKFSLDGDGSLEDGDAYATGTYSVEGSRVRFVAAEQGTRGCAGQEWEFEIALNENGTLDAELLQAACQTTAGTRWSFVKQPGPE